METSDKRLYKLAYRLSLFTIFYNIIEGIVSMILGYKDETLTLFGFGVDSFIEVMSGFGIAMMILRIRQNPDSPKSAFEKKALKITGTAFYFLSVGLIAGIVSNIINHHKPEATLWGVIISLVNPSLLLPMPIAPRFVYICLWFFLHQVSSMNSQDLLTPILLVLQV